jgi:steroid delta-isomerase-like uncharacterized protein
MHAAGMADPAPRPAIAGLLAALERYPLVAMAERHFVQDHDPAVPGLPPGPAGLKPIIAGFRAAFPDLQVTVEDQIAEGDKVVTRYTMRGTHQGAFMGLPPTGKHVTVSGIQIERVVQGQIVEHWRKSDDLGMMQQLGAVPPR